MKIADEKNILYCHKNKVTIPKILNGPKNNLHFIYAKSTIFFLTFDFGAYYDYQLLIIIHVGRLTILINNILFYFIHTILFLDLNNLYHLSLVQERSTCT